MGIAGLRCQGEGFDQRDDLEAGRQGVFGCYLKAYCCKVLSESHRQHREGDERRSVDDAVERHRCTQCDGTGIVDQFCRRHQTRGAGTEFSDFREDVDDIVTAGAPIVETLED